MRPHLLFVWIVFCLPLKPHTQEQLPLNVLGIRSEVYGLESLPGLELTYHTGISNVARVEVDFGFQRSIYTDFMHVAAMIEGVWTIKNNLKWYIGFGFQIGYYQTKFEDLSLAEGFGGGPCLPLGVEYDLVPLNVPLSVSLNVRPIVPILSDDLLINGIAYAVGIRYVFKE